MIQEALNSSHCSISSHILHDWYIHVCLLQNPWTYFLNTAQYILTHNTNVHNHLFFCHLSSTLECHRLSKVNVRDILRRLAKNSFSRFNFRPKLKYSVWITPSTTWNKGTIRNLWHPCNRAKIELSNNVRIMCIRQNITELWLFFYYSETIEMNLRTRLPKLKCLPWLSFSSNLFHNFFFKGTYIVHTNTQEDEAIARIVLVLLLMLYL